MTVAEAEALIAKLQIALDHGLKTKTISEVDQKLISSLTAKIRGLIQQAVLPEDEEVAALVDKMTREILPKIKEIDLAALGR